MVKQIIGVASLVLLTIFPVLTHAQTSQSGQVRDYGLGGADQTAAVNTLSCSDVNLLIVELLEEIETSGVQATIDTYFDGADTSYSAYFDNLIDTVELCSIDAADDVVVTPKYTKPVKAGTTPKIETVITGGTQQPAVSVSHAYVRVRNTSSSSASSSTSTIQLIDRYTSIIDRLQYHFGVNTPAATDTTAQIKYDILLYVSVDAAGNPQSIVKRLDLDYSTATKSSYQIKIKLP